MIYADPEQQADEDRLTAKVRQKSPAEWVEGLVQQMSGARDMGDARVRAAQELRAFEQTVSHTTNKVGIYPLIRSSTANKACSNTCT